MAFSKNFYLILNLAEPTSSSSSSKKHIPSPAEVKRAYKIALLSAHPDKASTVGVVDVEGRGGGGGGGGGKQGVCRFTVDDVREAYFVLGDEARRREYDGWVLRGGGGGRNGGGEGDGEGKGEFVLGLEVLDLSDFVVVADGDGEVWTRGCRCGDENGFRISEGELEEAVGRGDKEVLVGCTGCSLWVRVGFEVQDEDEDEEEG